MLLDEPDYVPYAPGARTVDVVDRIHQGRVTGALTLKNLQTLGVAEGNADRVQKALRFLDLIDHETFEQTPTAMRLRRATSDEYRTVLAEIVHGAYEPIFVKYDPATATSTELNDAFKMYEPAGQRENMIALFMALCRAAGLAPEVPVRKRGRPVGSVKIIKNGTVNPRKAVEPSTPPALPPANGTFQKTVALRSGSVTLTVTVELMDLEDEERTFVFGLIDDLKKFEKKAEAIEKTRALNPGLPGAAES